MASDSSIVCSTSDYDIEAEHKLWRQFEIRPNRSEETAEINGYDFRSLQQISKSEKVETMPFDYYSRLKYVKYDSILFQSFSDGFSGDGEALLEDVFDDEEVTIDDFPLYDQEIFDGQGWLTDDVKGEEITDILKTCTRDSVLLAMTEFEEEIIDMLPLLALVEDRVKQLDIYKMRFSHIVDRENLQNAFEQWLLDRINNNTLESLRLDTVEFGNHKTDWKKLLGKLIKNCEIPEVDIGFVGFQKYAFEMDFFKEHLECMIDKMLRRKANCEYAYRIEGEDLSVLEEDNMTESQENFMKVCQELGCEKIGEDADVIEYHLCEGGWQISVRLYSFIVTLKCERIC